MIKFPFNSDLLDDLANKKVAIFIGSGVSAGAITRDGKPLKTWEGFLSFAAEKIEETRDKKLIEKLISEKDYLLACELIKQSLGDSTWNDTLLREYTRQASPSDTHNELLKLDQRLIITTNFDKIIENAWPIVNESSDRYPTIKKKIDSSCFNLFRDSNNYIIKMHGCIDDQDSIIFSKLDYISRAYGSQTYKQFFEILFVTHTVVFVGFSMSDPIISMMMDDYQFKYSTHRPHYIFLPKPIEPLIEKSYKEIKGLYIQKYSPENNHAELAEQLASLTVQVKERKKEHLSERLSQLRS